MMASSHANDTPLTYKDAKKYFLSYPQAQGTENLFDVNVAGTLTASSNIKYADTSTQTSAYAGAKALAGTYTSTNMTIDANGKITALSSGSGGTTLTPNSITITPTANPPDTTTAVQNYYNNGAEYSVNLTTPYYVVGSSGSTRRQTYILECYKNTNKSI